MAYYEGERFVVHGYGGTEREAILDLERKAKAGINGRIESPVHCETLKRQTTPSNASKSKPQSFAFSLALAY